MLGSQNSFAWRQRQEMRQLMQAHQELLTLHKELLALVGTLVQQNERTLEALDLFVDDEAEPGTYLDGTPVSRN